MPSHCIAYLSLALEATLLSAVWTVHTQSVRDIVDKATGALHTVRQQHQDRQKTNTAILLHENPASAAQALAAISS